jgi:predicted nucleotidyltransferase
VVNKQIWRRLMHEPHHVADVSEAFLTRLVTELDNEQVSAIILKGSCARGDETVYSDVDLTVFLHIEPARSFHQRFYRDGRLISVGTHTFEYYRRAFLRPEEAIFVVPSTREARILLDKEGLFRQLQQEAKDWTWEPLQEVANRYACETMQEYTEIALKALRALLVQDALALAEMTLLLFHAVTMAIAVQRGILSMSGNSYFRQVQESVGFDTAWTRYHNLIAGVNTFLVSEDNLPERRGIAALRLYQETMCLLHPVLQVSQYGEVVTQTSKVIEEALARE